MKRYVAIVMLLALTNLAGISEVQGAFDAGINIQIPVVINLYPGSNTTEAEAKEAIKEANKLLKQAGMKLVPVDTKTPAANTAGDNGDGSFTLAERTAMRTHGGKELKKLKNEKGIKISFGNDPVAGTGTRGVSVHRNPTIIVRESTAAEGGAADTGQTIAHELGHVMTLGANHLVSKGPPEVKADDDAHSAGADHVMQATGKGTKFTAEQIKEMRSRRYHHGKCSVQWDAAYPAEKVKQQYGATTDNLGDFDPGIGTPMHDIDHVILTSLAGADHLDGNYHDVDLQITVGGTMPDNGFFSAIYFVGFNTDGDPTTGIQLGETPGIDRIVDIFVASEGPGYTYTDARVFSPPCDCLIDCLLDCDPWLCTDYLYLPQPPTVLVDNEFDGPGGPVPTSTSILCQIPKAVLGLDPPGSYYYNPIVPVVVQSTVFDDFTGREVPVDWTDDLVFDQDRWLHDPTLHTFGNGVPTPGAPYDVLIEGLQPNSPVTLYVNDTAVFDDVLDSNGSASATFEFPSDLPNTESHFLTAQDNTGEFAYNSTCPMPMTADLNGDGKVNMLDFKDFNSQWLNGIP